MSNSGRIIISIMCMIVCTAAGYFITDVILNGKQSPDIQSASSDMSSGHVEETAQLPVEPDSEQPQEVTAPSAPAPEVLEVSRPVVSSDGKSYTFSVSASGAGIRYGLADENGEHVGEPQPDNVFKVPATASGVYFVYVVDEYGRETEFSEASGCKPVEMVKKITKEEFTAVMYSTDEDKTRAVFKNRISTQCTYEFEGIAPEEKELRGEPQTYWEIINRLSIINIWSSIEVLRLDYTERGLLKHAVISVKY